MRRGVEHLSNYRGMVISQTWRAIAELRLNASAKGIKIYVSPEIGRLVCIARVRSPFPRFGPQSNSQSKSDKVSPTHFFLPAYAELGSKPQSNQKQGPVKPGKGWSNQKTFCEDLSVTLPHAITQHL